MRPKETLVKYITLFLALVLSFPMAAAEDFHKAWDNAESRRITIFTLHGDIKLSGYDGETIDITAVKKGPDRDRVEIEDASIGNQINIFPRYLDSARNNATVDFEIRVPKEIFYNAEPAAKSKPPHGERVFDLRIQRFSGETPESAAKSASQGKPAPPEKPVPAGKSTPLEKAAPKGKSVSSGKAAPALPRGELLPHAIFLKSTSGQITISDVAGSIRVETGGRNIELQNVEGMLSASSVSGDIRGVLKQASRHNVLHFASISGNISMQSPDDISAQVRIQSSTGQVKTDFPLEVREMRYGPGRFIQGKLGAGSHILDMRSVSGAINFSKKPSETKNK